MTLQDVFEVVSFYDKYEFAGGLQLCDLVILDHLKNNAPSVPSKDLNSIVASIALADNYGLEKGQKWGLHWLNYRFIPDSRRFNAPMFTLDHLTQLHPLFKKGLIECTRLYLPDLSQEEVDSPLFPRYLSEKISEKFESTDSADFARDRKRHVSRSIPPIQTFRVLSQHVQMLLR